MGWSFECGASKEKIVADLLKPWTPNEKIVSCVALKSKLTKEGAYSVLWVLWEQVTNEYLVTDFRKTEKFIACYLLALDKGYGWGYKDMCASMGPYYYSCPVEWFSEVSVENKEWRDKVLIVKEEKKEKNMRYKAVRAGESYRILGSKVVPIVKIIYKKGRSWIGCYAGKNYRIPCSMLGEVVA
jgi:hypothetical protein